MSALSGSQTASLRVLASTVSSMPGVGGLLILTFHRVLPEPDPLVDDPTAQSFSELLDMLASVFRPTTVRDAAARLRTGNLPPRSLCITFDDGYANNFEVALPILQAKGVPATFFVSTGFLGKGCMWNDVVIEAVRGAKRQMDLRELGLGTHDVGSPAARRRAVDAILNGIKYLEPQERLRSATGVAELCEVAIPTHLMMEPGEVRGLASRGMEIGSHTVSHPILARLEPSVAEAEISQSKHVLEGIIGARVTSFAYPNGRPSLDYDSAHVEMVRKVGFDAAVSTAWGCARPKSDPYQLPRIAPWDNTLLKYAARMLRSYFSAAAARVV
jgi:peptidoglycan/xylan/chitin deacetylase (PgdA/CDA1 family)